MLRGPTPRDRGIGRAARHAPWLCASGDAAATSFGRRQSATRHRHVIARPADDLDALPPCSAGSDHGCAVKGMSASPGIVVLDRSGRIGFATDGAATLLQLGDGLTARGGQLIGRRGGPRLEDSVQATLADPPDAPCGPLRTVVLCRRDRLPLIATLAPLTSAATGPLGALVLLHDPEAALRPATEVLRQAFGLTVAEAAVAQAGAGRGRRAPPDRRAAPSQPEHRPHPRGPGARQDRHAPAGRPGPAAPAPGHRRGREGRLRGGLPARRRGRRPGGLAGAADRAAARGPGARRAAGGEGCAQ